MLTFNGFNHPVGMPSRVGRAVCEIPIGSVRLTVPLLDDVIQIGVAGNLTMTGYWLGTPKVYNWFANGQFFFFLIAPACYAALSRARKPNPNRRRAALQDSQAGSSVVSCFDTKRGPLLRR
jgi:hypothetical protein